MKQIDVTIVKLEPMRMLSFYGYGEHPEEIAWSNLVEWVKQKNFTIDPTKNRIFGFNNPCPSIGSTNYGYEFWLAVDATVEPEGAVRISEFFGGTYAVTPCHVTSGEELPEHWKALNIWCETSSYSHSSHQWLEEHSPEGVPVALHLPVIK